MPHHIYNQITEGLPACGEVFGEYVDDGWSGTNFERPDFQRMMDDMEAGKVNCIVTKDCCAIMGLNQKDLENQGILA